ncbi:glutathione S-transferase [Erythrobacter gaetbuli]|uniref:Glutathione S-transferase n=1 Tax=Qipengyuania gaetbuli TaxID=266952 RepID=A0A844XYS5_9SPHN|nr:glutathione S-transferase family protein [Qipengyuania gaetbuli]MXO51145.1 glutathione S-transferase [Qipengyuania gaetbuli]
MAQYTFFTNPMSRGQIARWALHEVGADYATELVDWTNKPAGLTEANPLGKVPTLVHHHGGDHIHVVTETAAICHYLAEMHPERGLLPLPDEKADYFRYFFFAAGPVEQAVVSRAMGWSVDDPQKQGMLGYGSYERAMDTFDTLLTGRDFVCGDRFTMADVYVGSQVDWGLNFGSIPKRAVFEDYAARLRERTAYKEAKAIDMDLIAKAQANG